MPLGEAFQIADDVRGVLSGGPGLDLVHAKPTVLLARARELVGEADRTFLEDRFGAGPLDDEARDRFREILRSSGAVDAAVRLVEELVEEATAALDTGILEPESRAALEALAALVASSVG
jgi:geranylgeranyl pyrophosphate synthase